uniref:Uncharacterized protein n=1 Tax=Populus alba TaxID=43335 RepID=A0A4U5N9K0_POPAL|nr:hypothetical protein D5086_0000271460 [Populus alba]
MEEEQKAILQKMNQYNFPYDARDDDSLGSDAFTSPGAFDMKGNILKIDRLKHVKSVRESFQSKEELTAARSAISGHVLVAKACEMTVPRLTFWLSNSVVLRTIISQTIGDTESKISSGQHTGRKGNKIISSSLKWKECISQPKGNKMVFMQKISSDWEEPHVFYIMHWKELKLDLLPHHWIQSGGRLVHEDQGNISLEHGRRHSKMPVKDFCPVRAGAMNVAVYLCWQTDNGAMRKLRLDVAMFNAILRESVDESQPIQYLIPSVIQKFSQFQQGHQAWGWCTTEKCGEDKVLTRKPNLRNLLLLSFRV